MLKVNRVYALCKLSGVNFAAENCTRADAENGVGAGFHFTEFPARVRRDSRNQTHKHGGESQPFNVVVLLTIMKRRGATAAVTRFLSHQPESIFDLSVDSDRQARGRRVVQTAHYFSTETTKGDQPMKTKLDSMNHRQRAAFARSLYRKPTMTRNAVTAASAYGIRRAK